MSAKNIVIIGGGPAGLTAAYLLAKENINVVLLEADPTYVGGIARTVTYKGYGFDIGGHRFFSKAKEVEELWTEILPDDLIITKRSSRIFYKKKFFSYPFNAFEVLFKLGVFESILCVLSYLKASLFPKKNPISFTDWVSNHFGKRLFRIFFKTYTEKVWGMDCDAISSDWAAQRIKGLSLRSALSNAIFPKKKRPVIKTLIESFRYPRKGPGMLWEACATKIRELGGSVLQGHTVSSCQFESNNKSWQVEYIDPEGNKKIINATHVISSAPMRELVESMLLPKPSLETIEAAQQLKYRDFLIVILILKDKNQFSDNWIYIHEPEVDVARIQNFKSWSPDLIPNQDTCCYGMEYFCFEHDGLWDSSDQALIKKAKGELVKIGLSEENEILDGYVVRQPKAYPVYDEHYKANVNIIRQEISEKYSSLYLIGRNGMHKYNNQDHAMMTAMLAVKNILSNSNNFNLWNINQDAEYIEEGSSGEIGLRQVPEKL